MTRGNDLRKLWQSREKHADAASQRRIESSQPWGQPCAILPPYIYTLITSTKACFWLGQHRYILVCSFVSLFVRLLHTYRNVPAAMSIWPCCLLPSMTLTSHTCYSFVLPLVPNPCFNHSQPPLVSSLVCLVFTCFPARCSGVRRKNDWFREII